MAFDDHFVKLRTRAGEVWAVGDLPERQLRRLLDEPDAIIWRNLDQAVKIDYGSLVVEASFDLVGGGVRVACKRYRPRNWWKALCRPLRRARAWRAWRLGHALLARQIPTARPLAVCLSRRPWFYRQDYLLTEWIPCSENLHLWAWRLADEPPRERRRRAARCAESLGQLLGRLHAQHIAHRDLKGSNLLVVETNDGVTTYLIDVEDARFCRRLSRRRQVANLARLATSIQAHPWVTRALRCRFFRAYLSQFPPGTIDWKTLWRRVDARCQSSVYSRRM